MSEEYCVADVIEIMFHTEDREGFNFSLFGKSGWKVPHSQWSDANTFHTHLPFRQNMAPHLFPHLSTRNKERFLSLVFLCTLFWFPSFSPSPLLSSPSFSTQSKRTHTDAQIPTRTLLSPVASHHLPPSISPLTHTHTTGNCLASPPHILIPSTVSLSISHPVSLNISPPQWPPPTPTISPPPLVLRGREAEAQPLKLLKLLSSND